MLLRMIIIMSSLFVSSCSDKLIHDVKFLDPVCIRAHHQYRYLTCHDVRVAIGSRMVVIPEGFDTDLASIPRILWPFMSPAYSDFIGPSILHDYLYRDRTWMVRREVDDVFHDALITNGLDRWTAWKMWLAVRLFGNRFFLV